VAEVHAVGHAPKDELLRAAALLRPEIVMPVHGELRHMKAMAEMLEDVQGLDPQVILARPGQIWTLKDDAMTMTGETSHGRGFVDGELTPGT
jgi:ribonuclease J